MTQPTRTPNPATSTRPERSSKKVAHKKPLALLPWLLLLGLAALAALLWFAISKANNSDSKTTSPAVSTPGPSVSGPTTGNGPSIGPPTTGASIGAGSSAGAGTGGSGAAAGSGAAGGAAAGTPITTAGALIGGAGIAAAPASSAATSSGIQVAAPAAGTAGTVLFGEGSASIDSAGRQVLAAAAQNLKAAGAKKVQVLGYTDIVAGSPVNAGLSQQRADAVAAALKPLLPGVPVTAVAKGENDPAASNDTDNGRQQNRRVAIIGTT